MANTEEQKFSRMIITFASEGSALFDIQFENVTPTQLLAVAGFLEFKARYALQVAESRERLEEAEYEERHKLTVPPKPSIAIASK